MTLTSADLVEGKYGFTREELNEYKLPQLKDDRAVASAVAWIADALLIAAAPSVAAAEAQGDAPQGGGEEGQDDKVAHR